MVTFFWLELILGLGFSLEMNQCFKHPMLSQGSAHSIMKQIEPLKAVSAFPLKVSARQCENTVNENDSKQKRNIWPLWVLQTGWSPHRSSWPWLPFSLGFWSSWSPHRPSRTQCSHHWTQTAGSCGKQSDHLKERMWEENMFEELFRDAGNFYCFFICSEHAYKKV